MPRRRMIDMRNPYGSEGGYVTSSRRGRMGRRDRAMGRGMDYAYDRRDYRGGDYEYNSMRDDMAYQEQDMERVRRDYEPMGQSDMARRNYGDMRDMHYGERQGNFRPVEAMGYFSGYYGGGEDMARGGRRDYGYDMNYDMRGRYDYGYDYGEDYGQNLTKEELEHWKKKLMKEIDEQSKQFFETSNIEQKARQMGVDMKGYNPEELAIVTMFMYVDYCKTLKKYIGSNMDIYIELARDWLQDKDSAIKGSERLAIYHDEIVMGDDD